MADSQVVHVRGICLVCGCTDSEPCFDSETGETCAWADDTLTICTRCEAAANADEPMVVEATEGDLQAYLRARAAGA